jgi:uncharacterized protein YdaU (DUF1376 family)
MSRPWMAFYPADYRADTSHLRTVEHGAYFLLILHYWTTGGLPDDDADLARIAGMSKSEWLRSKLKIQAFFTDGWKHKRIDAELKKADEVASAYASRSQKAAKARWSKHSSSNASSIPQELLHDAQPQPHKNKMQPSAALDEDGDLFRRGKQVLGPESGSLISKLKKARGGVSQARAVIEQAATKENPRQYVGRVIAGPRQAVSSDGQPFPDGII